MILYTFTYYDGDIETAEIDIQLNGFGTIDKHAMAILQSRLRGEVSTAEEMGAGWYCPSTADSWNYGVIDDKFMLDRIKLISTCCEAKCEDIDDGYGVCSECGQDCELTYSLDT